MEKLGHRDFPQIRSLRYMATPVPAIGIIHPPPDIRGIAEFTAKLVAKRGPEFEWMLASAGNPDFNFLIPSDPFYAFYQQCLSERKFQLQSDPTASSQTGSFLLRSAPTASTQAGSFRLQSAPTASSQTGSFQLQSAPTASTQAGSFQLQSAPSASTQTTGIIHPPQNISDIVDAAAQLVAMHGPDFEQMLVATSKEVPEWKFLIPSDPFHAFYQNRLSEHKLQLESAPAASTPTGSKPSHDSFDFSLFV